LRTAGPLFARGGFLFMPGSYGDHRFTFILFGIFRTQRYRASAVFVLVMHSLADLDPATAGAQRLCSGVNYRARNGSVFNPDRALSGSAQTTMPRGAFLMKPEPWSWLWKLVQEIASSTTRLPGVVAHGRRRAKGRSTGLNLSISTERLLVHPDASIAFGSRQNA